MSYGVIAYAFVSMRNAVLTLAVGALACCASAQTPRPEKQYEIMKLADGVHAFLWKNPLENPIEGNALIVVNRDDVVLIDTGVFSETGEILAREIRKLTPLPVRYVVNTHWHDDHHGGNSAILKHWPGAEVIGHRDTRTDIIERSYKVRPKTIAGYEKSLEKYERWKATGKDEDGKPLDAGRMERVADLVAFLSADLPKFKGLRETPPTLTFADKMVLTRGERRIELIWLGLGNTRGDIVVFLPKERIVASGDLFVLPVPFAFGSYYEHWVDTLGKLDALEADIIVPGHGPVQRDRVALKSVRGLLEALVNEVKAAVATGATLEETRKRVKLADWREKFAGDDKTRQAAFSSFVLAAATERLWRQARGEADPPPSE